MEGALFIGEDLQTLRASLAEAEREAQITQENIRIIARILGWCLRHDRPLTECKEEHQ